MDWLATALTFAGVLLLARKYASGWLVCIAGNASWICHAFPRGAWALVVLNLLFVVLNADGWRRWRKAMGTSTGGIYRFKCEGSCLQYERFTWDSDVDKQTCPTCGKPAHRVVESSKHPGLPYDRPLMLRSIGVPPEQISEAQERFPHHKFAPDGRMIVESHQEYRRVLKDLGFEEV